ncbi:MAG: Ig-like domain repeat protein [Gemmatimonadales bacterium]
MPRRALVACTTAFAGFGCGGGDLVLPNTRAPAQLVIESGDFQTGTAGALLADPLVVRVTDAADRAVAGAMVVFSAADGGAIIPDTADTGPDGRVTVRWTLDPDPGTQRASAQVVGEGAPADLAVTFTASAGAGERPRLDVITQPSASARTGVEFARQPRVRVEDIDNEDRDGIGVVAALATGTGELRGTTRRETNGSGVAEFTDLRIDGPPGSYTLLFTAVGVDGAASAPIQLTAGKSPSTIRILEHTPDPSDVGRSVFVRVAVEAANGGSAPDGAFRVSASTGETCNGQAETGTCEFIFNSPGSRTLVARFLGSDDFEASESAPVSHTVNPVVNPTRTTIGTDPDPSRVGQAVTIFITVRGSDDERPRGAVVLYDQSVRCGSGEFLGQVNLNGNGQATFTTTQLAVGFHVIRACYTGTSEFAPSEDIANQTVLPD